MTLRVVEPGLYSLVVDGGRPGWRGLGVPVGGAADRFSLAVGNALVGSPAGAAALEMSLVGPTLRATCAVGCVVSGAPFPLATDRRSLRAGTTFTLEAGEELRVGQTPRLVRGYLCVRGGLQTPVILGSRSGLGPVKAGDFLPCEPGRVAGRFVRLPPAWEPGRALRVVDGLQAGWFDLGAFLNGRYAVSSTSDRMGVRLKGTPLRRAHAGELVSEPVCPGAIQVTNDGQCVILGVDGQTIGGYPKIAHVIWADLDAVGQLRPGDAVAFSRVSLGEAEEWNAARAREVCEWVTRLGATV